MHPPFRSATDRTELISKYGASDYIYDFQNHQLGLGMRYVNNNMHPYKSGAFCRGIVIHSFDSQSEGSRFVTFIHIYHSPYRC